MTQITEAQKFRISQDGGYPVIRTGAVDASPDSDLIAHVWNSDYLPLLAAAPELLEALKVMAEFAEGVIHRMKLTDTNGIVAASHAAIAKATGGAA